MSKPYLSQHTDKDGCFSLPEASNFHWKSIPKSHEKHVWKCICWLWWSRGVCGNVSRTLQTRKITKIYTTFLIIHYNRDSNTNWSPAAPRYSSFVQTLLSRCTENDLLQKLIIRSRCASEGIQSGTCVTLAHELVASNAATRAVARSETIQWNENFVRSHDMPSWSRSHDCGRGSMKAH